MDCYDLAGLIIGSFEGGFHPNLLSDISLQSQSPFGLPTISYIVIFGFPDIPSQFQFYLDEK